ncbi:uncharacterized protein LOC143557038 [Bidens hawaiensis]|uniref:uncharacterized protein LOC143557038 n=1 Tax=Bidens hawaiensis TaxID=980011 RepID=UPI00404B6840
MSSDSSFTLDFQPDIDDISNSDSENEAIFSAVVEAARLVVQNYESSQPLERRPHLQRDRVGAHDRLMKDYFSLNATFDSERFRHHFRMSRQLFLRILGDLESVYAFFQQRADARGKPGYSTMQKCTAAIRQLAYRTASDAMEEYLQMSATVAREALHTFCECILQLYHKIFEEADSKRHQYHQGDHDGPTVILEVAASFDLWIWHAFFGTPGAKNDIAVINASPIFDRLTDGVSPDISFSMNDVNYEYEYYLVDGIYTEWATLVHSFTCPVFQEKTRVGKQRHRKGIRCLLKKRWSIIRQPARFLQMDKLRNIMYACIILHNMILEDSGRAVCQGEYNDEPESICTLNEDEKLANLLKTRKREMNFSLRSDLVEHLWSNKQGDGEDNN